MSWIRMIVSGKPEKQGARSQLYIGNLQSTLLFSNPITCFIYAAREREQRETEQVSLGMEKVRLPVRQALRLLKA